MKYANMGCKLKNARQKQRKIYENQPNNTLYESEEKKHNINYTCKKCNLAFQRYYELIRHQKNHCFKEENNKKSEKAQVAAAQIAQNFSSEDSNSSLDINSGNPVLQQHQSQNVTSNAAAAAINNNLSSSQQSSNPATAGTRVLHGKSSVSTTDFSPPPSPTSTYKRRDKIDYTNVHSQGNHAANKTKLECNTCKAHFNYFEHFREHQLLHLVNTRLLNTHLSNASNACESFSSILQTLQPPAGTNVTHHHQHHQQLLLQQHQPPPKRLKNSVVPSIAADLSVDGADLNGAKHDNSLTLSVSNTKTYELLYQYFIHNENNNEMKQKFQTQQRQSKESGSEIDFLVNFYNQCESRKSNSYDFLYQYYQENIYQQSLGSPQLIGSACAGEVRPNIEFLLQFYHLNESKKFFLLNAPTSIQSTINTPLDKGKHNSLPMSNFGAGTPEPNNTTHNPSSSSIGPLDNFDNYNDNEDNDDDNNNGKSVNSNSRINDNKCLDANIQQVEDKHYSTVKPNPELNIDDIVVETVITAETNYTKRKSPSSSLTTSAISQSPLKVSKKTSDITAPPIKSDAYVHNFRDFLDSRIVDVPTTLEDCNVVLKKQGSSDENGGCATKGVTPSSSPNSNSNRNSVIEDTDIESKLVAGIAEKQQNKRLRTTILPDQLNFLYECYQNQSNPSRKMLEEIAKKVNLKKRVVQVSENNTMRELVPEFMYSLFFKSSARKKRKKL